jgi:subtilisin family serine protease
MQPFSGRGVRVAVIDSGVNPRHPHITGVAGGVSINASGTVVSGTVEEGAYLDALGHGTAVMAAIQEKAGNAEYFAVKVFHHSLRTTARSLARALEWAIEQRMDVVNLSLGTRNASHADLFRPLVERAVEHGVALVSALGSDGEPHYPGCLRGVFGVKLDPACDRTTYHVDQATFLASGYPRSAPGIPPERNLQGISFAVANMSGFIAQARESVGGRDLDALRAVLINPHTWSTP